MSETFDIPLIEPLARALEDEGYDQPTPIQQGAIPPALKGRDILGCAQTGTGKTAAFALPILNHLGQQDLKPVARRPLVLILAPTRELAAQIGDSFQTYGRYLNVSVQLIFGGVGQGRQVAALQKGVHVLVATPGRLLDLLSQEHIFLNRLQYFVLDEADRMLDMGFLPDIKKVIRLLPIRRQSMFFSATMPRRITQLADQLLHDPVRIDVAPKATNVELIDQRVIFLQHRQKKPMLAKMITDGDVGQAIVFTKTKRGANFVTDYLKRKKIDAVVIHGNKSQNARTQAMEAFRSEKAQVLVATDLAARGIDVDGITHVFNFELPLEAEQYVHRIGRTGRAGAAGVAISLCSPGERPLLKSIQKLIGFELLPDGREPDPLPDNPESEPETEAKSDSPPKRNRRHRRNRRGRNRGSASGQSEANSNQSGGDAKSVGRNASGANSKEQSSGTRPTAAQRKAARNRRRRKRSKDAES
ncbi:MAG: DEAD/DEAH box helicase [Fuerstiella sp.]